MSVSTTYWHPCPACKSTGRRKQKISKKVRLDYRLALKKFDNGEVSTRPSVPTVHYNSCKKCNGSGIQPSDVPCAPNNEWPTVAIIGAGIGGIALAVALSHRGIPFKIYEKDASFDARSQGYGLTLQQASKAMKGFGILQLEKGIVSTRHLVHDPSGKILAKWGYRKWVGDNKTIARKQTNIHIARQHLRQALLEELEKTHAVEWGQEFEGSTLNDDKLITIHFNEKNKISTAKADVIVGADGIHSKVRDHFVASNQSKFNYLGTIVILGICAYKDLENNTNELLDQASVFQTANGQERIYVMPFDNENIMWQLSYPLTESQAIDLSRAGAKALKTESQKRVPWHTPIPQIIEKTPVANISGYPVYDRPLWQPPAVPQKQVTLIGDAAHPMSPFKGQGANQALLDALELARTLYSQCKSKKSTSSGSLKTTLTHFENQMMKRVTPKVKESARAAVFLHSEQVLKEKDAPRGK